MCIAVVSKVFYTSSLSSLLMMIFIIIIPDLVMIFTYPTSVLDMEPDMFTLNIIGCRMNYLKNTNLFC